ncbi:MAG: hypothetical protein AAB965_01845, partial [Patescibacteria group bacterium]
PIAGKVLVSEGNGVGSWGSVPSNCRTLGNTLNCNGNDLPMPIECIPISSTMSRISTDNKQQTDANIYWFDEMVFWNSRLWTIRESYIYYSSDGATWYQGSNIKQGDSPASTLNLFQKLIAHSDGKLYLIIQYTNGAGLIQRKLLNSYDGATWNVINGVLGSTIGLFSEVISFNGRLWTVGGGDIRGSFVPKIYYSTVGIIWTRAVDMNIPSRTDFSLVVYKNKLWLLGGQDSSGLWMGDVWNTADPTVGWVNIRTNNRLEQSQVTRFDQQSLVYGGKLWMVGGKVPMAESKMIFSDDGINWTVYQPSNLTFSLNTSNSNYASVAGAGAFKGNIIVNVLSGTTYGGVWKSSCQ